MVSSRKKLWKTKLNCHELSMLHQAQACADFFFIMPAGRVLIIAGKSFSEARNICRTCCVPKLFWMSKQNKNNNLCTHHVLHVFWAYNFHEQSVVILCVDAKIRASDKDLERWPFHPESFGWFWSLQFQNKKRAKKIRIILELKLKSTLHLST